jgi:hypothetical protein
MKISKTHQNLSDYCGEHEVLTNPQKFLGPNWETVLRWWLYRESLTDEQKEDVKRRYWAIDRNNRDRYCTLDCHATSKVIGRDNRLAVKKISPFPTEITYELIANLDEPFFLSLLVPDFNKQPTMTYSKTHFNLSVNLNNQDILTNPRKYLGPNYKMVLDFWFYVDNNVVSDDLFLSKQNENVEIYSNGIIQSCDTVDAIVGSTFRIAICRSCPTVYISLTTYEIISLYDYIGVGNKLVFLPLFGAFLDEWNMKQLKTAHFALTRAADHIYNLEGMSSVYRDVQKVIDEHRRALKIASVLKK